MQVNLAQRLVGYFFSIRLQVCSRMHLKVFSRKMCQPVLFETGRYLGKRMGWTGGRGFVGTWLLSFTSSGKGQKVAKMSSIDIVRKRLRETSRSKYVWVRETSFILGAVFLKRMYLKV